MQDSNTWVSGNAFCMVRMGNTLAYPVTTSYGWSNDGTSYPTQCTKDAASADGSAAKYYCNKFDVNVGLIYYPVANQNTSATFTYRPTRSPTERPTPPPGAPTINPTRKPSPKPTTTHKPTAGRRRQLRQLTDDPTDDPAGGDDGAGDDGAGDDGNAADDQYATTGIGTYSDPYFANSATDDFQPLIPEVVDNGLIFALGRVCLILATVYCTSLPYSRFTYVLWFSTEPRS